MEKGFVFRVGDVIVPVRKDSSYYLQELIINAINVTAFTYTVIDLEGDEWEASPLMIENSFTLKGAKEDEHVISSCAM